jgi:hypothetical protein
MRAALTIAFGWLLLTCVGAAPAAAELNIGITKPAGDSLAEGDPLEIAVLVFSPPAEITSMQAAVGARTLTLTKDGVNRWSGSLSLTGLPRGQHQLAVTATNVASETQQVTIARPTPARSSGPHSSTRPWACMSSRVKVS